MGSRRQHVFVLLFVVALVVLSGVLLSAAWLIPAAMAQPACVTQNMAVPPGANATSLKPCRIGALRFQLMRVTDAVRR